VIGIDVTPLVLGPRTGVARALWYLLHGWSQIERPRPVVLLSPGPVPNDVPTLDGVHVETAGSARRFRSLLPKLTERVGASVFLSPWSAFPRLKIPTIVLVHELPWVRIGPVEGLRRTTAHKRWLRRNAARCAAIVAPSQATRDDLLHVHSTVADRVHVIAHGFDPAPWDAARRDDAPLPYAIAVGTGAGAGGTFKKGLDRLHAIAKRRRFLVVGPPASERLDDAFERRAFDDEELRFAVASARLLAYPSRSEGFGYPPLEAMAAGTAVVTTDAGAIPEVVGDAAVCVPDADMDTFGEAVEQVWSDAGLRARLIEAGTQRVSAFPCDDAARRWAALVEQVLESQ